MSILIALAFVVVCWAESQRKGCNECMHRDGDWVWCREHDVTCQQRDQSKGSQDAFHVGGRACQQRQCEDTPTSTRIAGGHDPSQCNGESTQTDVSSTCSGAPLDPFVRVDPRLNNGNNDHDINWNTYNGPIPPVVLFVYVCIPMAAVACLCAAVIAGLMYAAKKRDWHPFDRHHPRSELAQSPAAEQDQRHDVLAAAPTSATAGAPAAEEHHVKPLPPTPIG